MNNQTSIQAKQTGTDLSAFNVDTYSAGPTWKVLVWFLINYFLFNTRVPWPYSFKCSLLRLFGAKIGKGVVIKTLVRIKKPWCLVIGNNSWIGESVWIDNLENVFIGSNVCISQGAMLLTGNHDYTLPSFPYRLGTIRIEDGVWIGAKAIVCPNVVCKSHSILTVQSVASKEMLAWTIYSGNPATIVRDRKMLQTKKV